MSKKKEKNEEEEREKEAFFTENMVDNKFKVGKKIGAGSFGELRLGTNSETQEPVAIKFEPKKVKGPTLKQEYKYYKKVGEVEGIPKIYFFGTFGKWNSLVMELLWKSLQDCFEVCGKKFTVKTTIQVALQMITRIEYVHSKGLLYRDIKPENFLFGRDPKHHLLYLIDFGLSKEYLDKEGKHIPYKEGKSLTGTARYMSINTHLGREQSRRDDLEAVGHALMFFLRGNLPWQKLKVTDNKDKYKMIGESKQNTSIETLCEGFPDEFAQYMKYCRGLEYTQDPDYAMLKKLFTDLFQKSQFPEDNVYDWDGLSFEKKAKTKESKTKLTTKAIAGSTPASDSTPATPKTDN